MTLSRESNTTGELADLGVTHIPTKEGEKGKSSAINPSGIHININPQLSPLGAAESFSHEGYGHALMYIITQNRSLSVHLPGGGSNLMLHTKIINARKETIENINKK